jgi:hypothetical protein
MNKVMELKILPVNKTVVFTSPLEGNDVLVRTGTVKEGSCFFHSILHAYSKDYVSMNKTGRMKLVRKLRASMAGKIDKDSWEEMAGGVIAKAPFQEMVNKTLSNFELFLNGTDEKIRGRATRKAIKLLITNEKEMDVYKIIISLVSTQLLVHEILPTIYKKSSTIKIKDTINIILEECSNHFNNLDEIKMISKEKREYLLNVFQIYLKVVCNEAYKETYKNYVKGLETTTEDVDSYSIDFVSDRFERDLYFINGKTRLPYTIDSKEYSNTTKRKCIILISIDQNHYEVMGRLLPGNKIQREFDCTDPIVTKMYTFLNEPSKLKYKYPELKEFLPKSPTRRNMFETNDDDNDDEEISDKDSDLYYDSSGVSNSESDSDCDSEDN